MTSGLVAFATTPARVLAAVVMLQLERDDPLSTVLTLDEAAQVAHVSVRTIRRWIAEGRLPVLPGGRVVERGLLDVERQQRRTRHAGRRGPRLKGA